MGRTGKPFRHGLCAFSYILSHTYSQDRRLIKAEIPKEKVKIGNGESHLKDSLFLLTKSTQGDYLNQVKKYSSFFKLLLDSSYPISYKRLRFAQIAQSVEQRTENPRVGSSILSLGTIRNQGVTSFDVTPFSF